MDSNDTLLQRLKAIAGEFPDLAQTARLYEAVLPVLRDEELPVLPAGPVADEVRDRLGQGLPFLEGLDLEADSRQVAGLLVRLAAAAEKVGARVSADRISRWLNDELGGDVSAAFQAILAGDDEPAGNSLVQMGIDRDVCRLLAQSSMKPLLRSWRVQIAPLAAIVKWDKGTCFVCGSEPLFAELQGNGQEKHLRCGLCGADWRVARLSCPHCGNEDHRSLKVLFPESDPARPRVEACDRCMAYVKVIPAFAPTPVDLLPVEDLATLHLDAAAQQCGYRSSAAECS